MLGSVKLSVKQGLPLFTLSEFPGLPLSGEVSQNSAAILGRSEASVPPFHADSVPTEYGMIQE